MKLRNARKQSVWSYPVLALFMMFTVSANAQTPSYQALMQDIIINADLWTDRPEILSANYAFEGIQGLPGDEESVRAGGGTWNTVSCEDPSVSALTSSNSPQAVALGWGYPTFAADAMPVVFSWPVLPSTVHPTDFLLTLNTGEQVNPQVASILPNHEYNERHVVVIFGEFGNRLLPDDPDAVYVTFVEIIDDGTPLMLVGPNGSLHSAVGLTWESTHPYVEGNGPTLVAAKLNHMSVEGEGAPDPFAATMPNDGVALYGEDAQYRLRMYTSGGFSPDGVASVKPTEFSRFFRIHAENASGDTILITETGLDYQIDGYTLRVIGLADLGVWQEHYDDCYVEDHDNYIDIILRGDEDAMRTIVAVEIPAGDPIADPNGQYDPFYNPGGPGNNPTPGVTYTVPGPYVLQPVTIALDDPMTTTYRSSSFSPFTSLK